MQEAYRKQVQDVETTYNAIIEIARQAGISTVGLEKQKQQEISQQDAAVTRRDEAVSIHRSMDLKLRKGSDVFRIPARRETDAFAAKRNTDRAVRFAATETAKYRLAK